jgi:hypothetical protein
MLGGLGEADIAQLGALVVEGSHALLDEFQKRPSYAQISAGERGQSLARRALLFTIHGSGNNRRTDG